MSRTHLMLDIPTNLIVDPEDFVDPGSAWSFTSGATGVDNTDTAPDGTLTADSISSDTTEPYTDDVTQDVALTSTLNAPYTYSVHMKKESTVERDHVYTFLYLLDGAVINEQVQIQLDLETGKITVFGVSATNGPGYSEDGVTVESLDDYWRVSFTLTDYAGTADMFRVRHRPWAQGSGHPARTIVLWGAQLLNRDVVYPYFNSNSQNSATITPLYRTNETGALQVKVLGGSCGNVRLQGCARVGLEWTDIKATGDMGGLGEDTEVLYTNLALLPHLRVRLIQSSDVSLKAYLME